MTMMDHEFRAVQERLARVERNCRWLKLGCAALFVATIGVFVMGQAEPGKRRAVVDQLDVRTLVLRDEGGHMHAWLGTGEQGTRLLFFDNAGEQRAGFGLTKDNQPAMALFDRTDKPLIVLGVAPGSWPSLLLYDPAGHKRAALTAEEDWSSIFFFDANEKKRAGLGYVQEGAAVNLFDERGDKRIGLSVGEAAVKLFEERPSDRRTGLSVGEDASSLLFFDRYGNKRAGVGITTKDEAALGFFDGGGRTRAAIGIDKGTSRLDLYGTNGMQSTMLVSSNGANVALYEQAGGAPQWKAR